MLTNALVDRQHKLNCFLMSGRNDEAGTRTETNHWCATYLKQQREDDGLD